MVQPDGVFQAVGRSKLYASVVEQILAGIRSGLFPPGSALPAERTLASELQVSRGSLREALRVLEHAGVLDVRTGSGTYVATEGGSSATFLRAQAAAIGEHSPLDLIVARTAIEPVCAQQAALSHHPTDLTALEQALDEQTWSELKHRSRSRAHAAEEYLEHHRLVLRAIQQRDTRRAHQLMAMHMSAVETALLAELEHGSANGLILATDSKQDDDARQTRSRRIT